MRNLFVIFAFVFALSARAVPPAATSSTASPPNPSNGHDLGRGLAYYRVHQLPGDLPTAESVRKQACVLDLRYLPGGAPAATALDAWLKFHTTAQTPVFVLANFETSAALRETIIARGPGLVVIGIPAPDFTPDIALKIFSETERRAYEAFEQGVTLAALLNDTPEKPRNDEARLAREHLTDGPAGDDGPITGKTASSAPVIDAALQRAVQLHRAMLALKKL